MIVELSTIRISPRTPAFFNPSRHQATNSPTQFLVHAGMTIDTSGSGSSMSGSSSKASADNSDVMVIATHLPSGRPASGRNRTADAVRVHVSNPLSTIIPAAMIAPAHAPTEETVASRMMNALP